MLFDFPFKIGHINVEIRIYRPKVFGSMRNRDWAIGVALVRTGIKDVFAIGHKVGASGAALAGADHWRPIGSIRSGLFDVDVENLIAFQPPFRIGDLTGKLLAIGAEISFSIVAPKSELPDMV